MARQMKVWRAKFTAGKEPAKRMLSPLPAMAWPASFRFHKEASWQSKSR
jgi:hypothetical protein